jgi:hypothetical protein
MSQAPLLASPLLLAIGLSAAAGPEDLARKGLEVATAAHRANEGFASERATIGMELINAHGDVTSRRLTVETLEGRGDGDKSKLVFEWPADVTGTKLLTWTHKAGEDDQWLYLPAIKRIRRIGGSNKTGSFMGSEFAYEDLASTEPEKFTYRYLDEPRLGERSTSRIERFPVDQSSGYARQVVWLDKEYQSALRVEYYDRKNVLLKVASFAGYKPYGRWWRPTSVTMDNVLSKKRSVLRWQSRQIGARLAPQDFDSARLED